ncbi:MAG: hypothetical protein OEV74_21145, partial [Cyclobacteriaceae bacterium]|nr:hypothetical protein [Cyclobacteriaceae bacterium]
MFNKKILFIISFIPASLILLQCSHDSPMTSAAADWPEYHGGPDRNHYSLLREIDATNVGRL